MKQETCQCRLCRAVGKEQELILELAEERRNQKKLQGLYDTITVNTDQTGRPDADQRPLGI